MREVKDSAQLNQYLQAHRITSVFPERLQPHLALYDFERGDLICSQGAPAETLYVLVKGKVKVFNTSAEGRSLILSFKKPLDLMGDIEYVHRENILNTVEAVSPVSMIGVHYQWLKAYASDHAPLLQFLLTTIAAKFYHMANAMSFNLMHPAEVRLASYLLSVSFDEADAPLDGSMSAVHLTDTANLIGTSYRHLNRIIRQFCAEDVIERHRGGIRVKDRDRLSALAGRNIYE
ncbi:cyclic nucleotide-binding domain-containing protein [bacterium]|nr:cyclic nucleotide-binding domain-containing protein [bacterium]